jgi:hypothetical protein
MVLHVSKDEPEPLGQLLKKEDRKKGLSSYPVGQSSVISCRRSDGFLQPQACIWCSFSKWVDIGQLVSKAESTNVKT